MKNADERRLQTLMDIEDIRGADDVAPPTELIGQILADIPADLPAMDLAGETSVVDMNERRRGRFSGWAWTRLAAMLAVVVLGGWLASSMWRQGELRGPDGAHGAGELQESVQGGSQESERTHRSQERRGSEETPESREAPVELYELDINSTPAPESTTENGLAATATPGPAAPAAVMEESEASLPEDLESSPSTFTFGLGGRRAPSDPGTEGSETAIPRPGDADIEVSLRRAIPVEAVPPITGTSVNDNVFVVPTAPPPAPSAPPPPPQAAKPQEETIVVSGEMPSVLASSEVSTTYDFEQVNQLPVQGRTPSPPPPPPPSAPAPPSPRSVGTATTQPSGYASTGGTHEPNGAPYGDVFFEHAGVNPFIDTEDDSLSTFGLDVDTASLTVVRKYLEGGHLPPADAVRVEEILNYFDFDLPAPAEGADFALEIDGGETPFTVGPRYQLLRVGLRARDIDRTARQPVQLVFVIDTSGSMDRGDRLELVKLSLFMLLDQLNAEDLVGLVTYGDRGQVHLEPTSDREKLKMAILGLQPGGSTNAAEGLTLGYQMASRHFIENGFNRVVLCSDGVANVGPTGPDQILELIGRSATTGIQLSTVGFGMGNYNDVLMEQLANRGDGNYAYVDGLVEAERIFVEEIHGTLLTVAEEAKVQVEFDPSAVESYRLFGYENRDIADKDFRNDKVDAGEVGAGHSVTALYEVKLKRSFPPRRNLGTVRLRYRPQGASEFVEVAEPISRREVTTSWRKMEPQVRFAALAAEFAEILRRSFWAKGSTLANLEREVVALAPRLRGDEDFAEFHRLVEMAARIAGPEESGGPTGHGDNGDGE